MRKSLTLLITLALVVVGVQGFAQQSAYEYCTTFNQIKAQAIDSTATVYGTAINRVGYGKALFVYSIGTTSGAMTTVSYNITIQHSTDSTTWSTLSSINGVAQTWGFTGSQVTSANTVFNSAYAKEVSLKNASKWIRVKLDYTYNGDTSLTLGTSIVAILGDKKYRP